MRKLNDQAELYGNELKIIHVYTKQTIFIQEYFKFMRAKCKSLYVPGLIHTV